MSRIFKRTHSHGEKSTQQMQSVTGSKGKALPPVTDEFDCKYAENPGSALCGRAHKLHNRFKLERLKEERRTKSVDNERDHACVTQ